MSAGSDIVSMSGGGTGNSLTNQRVMTMAQLSDIVLPAAAGNSGDSIPMYPAAYSETIGSGQPLSTNR